jgi:tetratricopeptide (TPR) repeat protein
LRGGRQQEALAEIGAEIENVRLSWCWALAEVGEEAARIEVLEDALEGLFHFYDMRSWFEEGEEVFSQAASIFGKATGKRERIVLGKLLARQGWFAFHLGQHEQGRRLLQQSLELLQSLGAQAEMVFPLNYLGAVTRHLGESDQAKQYLQESLAICKEMGDRYGLTIALNILGQVAYLEGEYAEARRLSQECLAIKREIDDQWGMTFSLTYLGTVAKALGDYQEAKQLFQESIVIGESIGDQRGRATGLNNIGDAVAALGEYSEAKQLYQESLTIFREIGNQLGIITSLTNLGNISCALGEYQEAWRLFQSALKLALANRVTPKVLDVFAGVAELWLKEEKTQRALEILVLIVNHPASSKENQDRAVRLLSDLMPQLSAEMMSLTEQIEQGKLVEELKTPQK